MTRSHKMGGTQYSGTSTSYPIRLREFLHLQSRLRGHCLDKFTAIAQCRTAHRTRESSLRFVVFGDLKSSDGCRQPGLGHG